MKQEKYDLFEHNLAVLGTYGIHYTDLAKTKFLILQAHVKGEITLTPEQLESIVNEGLKVTNKHIAMLRMNREDRMNYKGEDSENE